MSEHATSVSRVRARNRLSATKVAKVKVPGLYEDGAGLRLVISDKGNKRWTLCVTINGRRVERGLGVWPTVGLDDARREAEDYRQAAKGGRDARLDKLAAHRNTVSFQGAFEEFFAIRRQHLSNGKHVAQWQTTMRRYVFPSMGGRAIDEITAADVIDVLKPLWFAKPETAARVLQRVSATFDSAILRGTREKANPCTGVARELGTRHRAARHHSALAWRDVPDFVRDLRQRHCLQATRLAFEFLILTAARSGEVRGALWQEIDIKRRRWTIPGLDPLTGRRMKSGEEHIVPLSAPSIAILNVARQLHHGELVFPGTRGQSLSDNTLSKLMRDAGVAGTPHGMRSAFKDWAAENGVRDEVSEAALAHVDRNRVRAAYLRTGFIEERAEIMERWGEFVAGGK